MIEEFERHLRGTNLSENTISSYLFALRQYSSQYDGITKKNLRAYNWNVPGIYFAEEQGIMYALESAYAPRAKGGWAARREREAAAALAESSIDNEEVNN